MNYLLHSEFNESGIRHLRFDSMCKYFYIRVAFLTCIKEYYYHYMLLMTCRVYSGHLYGRRKYEVKSQRKIIYCGIKIYPNTNFIFKKRLQILSISSISTLTTLNVRLSDLNNPCRLNN